MFYPFTTATLAIAGISFAISHVAKIDLVQIILNLI